MLYTFPQIPYSLKYLYFSIEPVFEKLRIEIVNIVSMNLLVVFFVHKIFYEFICIVVNEYSQYQVY